jgi:hypothetical protein
VFAGLGVALGRIANMMETRENRQKKLYESLHQIPIAPGQIALTTGAGVLDMPDLLGPKTGYVWSVRRLVASGFTAGTVTVYKSGVVSGTAVTGGEPVLPFAQAASVTIGRSELLLFPGDRLIFAATGITGTVQINGAADIFESWLLPEYIG